MRLSAINDYFVFIDLFTKENELIGTYRISKTYWNMPGRVFALSIIDSEITIGENEYINGFPGQPPNATASNIQSAVGWIYKNGTYSDGTRTVTQINDLINSDNIDIMLSLVIYYRNSGSGTPTGVWIDFDTYRNGVIQFAVIGGDFNVGKFFINTPLTDEFIGEDIGEKSTVGGQDGTYTYNSDIIGIPSLPTINACSCGLVQMFEITTAQAYSLANFLWSSPSEVLENLSKLFANPMDAIISLHLTQVSPLTSSGVNIAIAGVDTGVQGLPINSQYVTLDCGSITVDKYWGSSLDFSPYTKASIYLPMIGTQNLSIDDIMGKTLNVTYNIDLLSGSIVCFISVNNSVMYTFQGNCISKIPITGADALQIYGSVVGGLANVGASVVSGGGSALLSSAVQSGLSVMASKERVDKGGGISSTAGILGVKYPVLMLERAVQSLPDNFKHYKGYTSNITTTISNLEGYTEIEYIDISGVQATKNEIEMLTDLLQTGFYI